MVTFVIGWLIRFFRTTRHKRSTGKIPTVTGSCFTISEIEYYTPTCADAPNYKYSELISNISDLVFAIKYLADLRFKIVGQRINVLEERLVYILTNDDIRYFKLNIVLKGRSFIGG